MITSRAKGKEHRAASFLFLLVVVVLCPPPSALFAADLPELTATVNDFAHVIDAQSTQGIDRLSRALKAASGDVVVVATVQTIEPYGDIQSYATKLFENGGRGVGDKGKDNGVLILLALKERKVRIEVGYGLEQWITDRFAGETSRQYMVPEFRNGAYGTGLLAGTARVVGRIAKAKNLKLDVQVPQDDEPDEQPRSRSFPAWLPILIFIAILVISRIGGGPGASMLLWGLGPWSRWSSGVGPFGGGRGGGFGGGGFGGGFGGFGGGRSGGGGGGGGW